MKVLIDVNHPAHVHFFRVPAQQLLAAGHEVVFTSRDKDVTQTLLEEIGIKHLCLSSMGGGVWGQGNRMNVYWPRQGWGQGL